MASFLERYHESTKYDPRTIDRARPADWSARPHAWKEISGREAVDIRAHMDFLEAVLADGAGEWSPSARGRIDLAALCRISWFSAGVSALSEDGEETVFFRTNPSAGGLYPVELYWWCEGVDGIDDGIWHFHSPGFSLVPVWKGRFSAEVSDALLGFPLPKGPKAVAILTGLFSRGAWRYHERAWRRMLLDAGHLEGNLLLAAEREGIPATPLSGFRDRSLSDLLFPDEDEVPLLCVPLAEAPDRWPRARRSLPSGPEAIPADFPPDGMQRVAHSLGDLGAGAPPPEPVVATAEHPDGIRLLPGGTPPGLARAGVERRSCRSFARGEIDLERFSSLLSWAVVPESWSLSPRGLLRTWLVNLSVEGIPKGVGELHGDGILGTPGGGDLREECRLMGLGQALCADAAFLLVHTASLPLSVESMGERAYRPLCMDAGHHGQRIALAAQAMGLGASGIGGYFDDLVNETLGLDASEAVLYVTAVGRPEVE